MFTFDTIIVLLALIVLFSYVAELIQVPYPIILMLLGLGLGYLPHSPPVYSQEVPHVHIPREILLPLFLPPILFWGAMLTNWHEFKRHSLLIASLGILLVLVTAFLVAFVVNGLFSELGFIPALLLGAIISPSDAVCATAILSRLKLSSRVVSILEGESLINDAAGIMLYNFALAMLLNNTNFFNHPIGNFLIDVLGGIAVGAVIGVLFGCIVHHLSHKKENSLPIIVSLIIPYLVFYTATRLDVSNVLAVVSAGMCMRLLSDKKMEARSRLQGIPVWDTLIFILNGLVFIMLGWEFPKVIKKTISVIPIWTLMEVTVAVLVCIVVVRIIWVYITAKLLRSIETWKENLLIAWAGMRGIVSLALALSIPTVFTPSSALAGPENVVLFVTREVILFVAVVTILFTVVVQGLTLPWLIKRLKIKSVQKETDEKMLNVFEKITQDMIHNIQATASQEKEPANHTKDYILSHYQHRLQYSQMKKEEKHHMILQYYHHERGQLRDLYRRGEIDAEIFSRLMRYLDIEETKHSS